jgi:hypothetical protein
MCSDKTRTLHEKIISIGKGKLITADLGITGLILIDQAAKIAINYQSNSIIAMLIYFASYFLIGLWLAIDIYLLPVSKNH